MEISFVLIKNKKEVWIGKLDKGFGFGKLKVVKPTALSVRRDGGFNFYG